MRIKLSIGENLVCSGQIRNHGFKSNLPKKDTLIQI